MRAAFVSGMDGAPWGGSEILWSEAALRLNAQGHKVFAVVKYWREPVPAVAKLKNAGVAICFRRARPSFVERSLSRLRRIVARQSQSFIDPAALSSLLKFQPDVVCVSHGGIACGLPWMEVCHIHNLPCISVVQANAEHLWPEDELADRLIEAHAKAKLSCFVSQGNLGLFQAQLGICLPNTAVVRNPVQVKASATVPWPGDGPPWKLAFVGRLDPGAKGQDLVLKVLAEEPWRSRPLRLSFFGTGPMQRSLVRLANALNVQDRIEFCGHQADVESIWAGHHGLVLTSRYEGLPLALVEAMLCGRISIVTNVSGNAELLQDNLTGFIASSPSKDAVAEALERAWSRRAAWQELGESAAKAARASIPPDPAACFADLVLQCAASEKGCDAPVLPVGWRLNGLSRR